MRIRTKYFDLFPLCSIRLWKCCVEQVFFFNVSFGLVPLLRGNDNNKCIDFTWIERQRKGERRRERETEKRRKTERENNVTQIKNLLCSPLLLLLFFSHNISFAHFEFHLSLLFGSANENPVWKTSLYIYINVSILYGFCVHFIFACGGVRTTWTILCIDQAQPKNGNKFIYFFNKTEKETLARSAKQYRRKYGDTRA